MLEAAISIFTPLLSVIAFFGLLLIVERGLAALQRWVTKGLDK